MKKFWLRVILYAGYLNLTAWVVVGLPFLLFMIAFFSYFGRLGERSLTDSVVWESIVAMIKLLLIYFFIILFSIKGIKSTKKILRGEEPSKLDILYIVLMVMLILCLIYLTFLYVYKYIIYK